VRHADADALDVELEAARQRGLKRRLVGVAGDGMHGRAEPAQLVEEGGADEVARVEDEIGGAEPLDARVRQAARAPRQMRVGDDGDERQATQCYLGDFGAATTRNGRLTTSVTRS
jgi:hypothetical protein